MLFKIVDMLTNSQVFKEYPTPLCRIKINFEQKYGTHI